MIDAIVRQIDGIGGVVIQCSCVTECMKANPDLSQAKQSWYAGCGKIKNCLLSVPNHGERCMAYPQDTTTWLIHSDVNKIQQIPTNDGIIR